MSGPKLDIARVRGYFPALFTGFVFGDNAAGSQAAQHTMDRIINYLAYTYVQPRSPYPISQVTTDRLTRLAPDAAAKMFNAGDKDKIVWGMSSTANLKNLADVLGGDLNEGEEIVISYEHEANTLCWEKLAEQKKAGLQYWAPDKENPTNPANPFSVTYNTADLVKLINPKTRIVAITPASNILGSTLDIKDIIARVRAAAKQQQVRKLDIVVDLVAWVPHRFIDVRDWDVDHAVISYYKVFGPHVSAMYNRASEVHDKLPVLIPELFQLENKQPRAVSEIQYAGPAFELVWGSTGTFYYLEAISPSGTLKESYDLITEYDQTITKPLLDFLAAPEQRARGVRVVGREVTDSHREPTICFVVVGDRPIKSQYISEKIGAGRDVGVKSGNFSTFALLKYLGLDPVDGVVRISLLHYNTVQDVEKIIAALKPIFAA